MAQLGQHFDATTVDPNSGFDPVPPGKYLAHIISSDMRATKNGDGQYLFLEMEIIDGPETGRKLFDRLNLVNANETAVRIAQQTLSQICHAVGIMGVDDSEKLHARRMLCDVRVEPGRGAYRDSNRIVSYAAPDGSAPPARAAAPQAAPAAAAPAAKAPGATPPWRSRTAA